MTNEELRRKYRPGRVRLLFIGESPPASGRFFYRRNSGLYLAEHPALNLIYRFKQRLCYLLLKKHKTRRQCQKLIPRFLRAIDDLRQSGPAPLVTLGETLHSWSEEIARMWRFTRSNGITEGFHNKMETISRQAYGFRNFENYRQRVQVLCA